MPINKEGVSAAAALFTITGESASLGARALLLRPEILANIQDGVYGGDNRLLALYVLYGFLGASLSSAGLAAAMNILTEKEK